MVQERLEAAQRLNTELLIGNAVLKERLFMMKYLSDPGAHMESADRFGVRE